MSDKSAILVYIVFYFAIFKCIRLFVSARFYITSNAYLKRTLLSIIFLLYISYTNRYGNVVQFPVFVLYIRGQCG